MFSFKYSPRPNTLADKRMPDDVPERDKTSRIVALQQLQRGHPGRPLRRDGGATEAVLVDAFRGVAIGRSAGRTSGNTIVNFPGTPDRIGRMMPVRITGHGPNSLRGEALNPVGPPATQDARHAD